jgi:hypothetical protein
MTGQGFLHKYNTDNVHSRAVIVGVLNMLNNHIFIENVLSDSNIDVVEIPFYYNMGGDERFLQDYFLHWNDCLMPRMADGNYDQVPRGIVTLTSNTVNTSAMTHRFVRGTYVKEVDGKLQQYNSFLNSIPLKMAFEIKVETDSYLDAMKIQQSILETFYKVQVFSVTYKGLRVPCQVGFPEDYTLEKTFEFTYQSDSKIFLNFSLDVETYFPVFDVTQRRLNNNRMVWPPGPGLDTSIIAGREIDRGFEFTDPLGEEKFYSSSYMNISWKNDTNINRVNLEWRIKGSTGAWNRIATEIPNNGSYEWRVPFLGTAGNILSADPNPTHINTTYGIEGSLRAVVSSSSVLTNLITINPGLGYQPSDTVSVSPSAPGTTFTAPVIQLNTSDGQVAGAKIISAGTGLRYTPENKIELRIVSGFDENVFGLIKKSKEVVGTPNPVTGTMITVSTLSLTTLTADYAINGLEISGPNIQPNTTILSYSLTGGTGAGNGYISLSNEVLGYASASQTTYTLEPTNSYLTIQ